MNLTFRSVAGHAFKASFVVILLALLSRVLWDAPAQAQSTPPAGAKLAENGRALMPIVVSPEASEREKAAAQTLAEYLKRITGGDFSVQNATAKLTVSTPGLVLGTVPRFATGDALAPFKLDDATATEDYLLRSHKGGVLLIGASELAVENAVWDFLYRLGYRQFFPGEKWEIVPDEKNLSVSVNTFEHPDYYTRRISPGYGTLPENRDGYAKWNARNRMVSGFSLSTSHAYGKIMRDFKAEFAKHPEYLTKPGSSKFCVSNPGLQQLVIRYALAQFEKNPDQQSVSLDPSDGGGWESDSCPDAEKIGSVTDRVITLANIVAEAVMQKYPDKYIGVYAYNEHSPPPTIKPHPRVVPSIATSFIRGGFTLDELLSGWGEKAAQIGIREYYSVNTWDRDLPGRARGANLDYMTRTIPEFHGKGARFLISEASDNWGPNGLGYYIASRVLWDVDEAAQVEALTDDFLSKAFGAAREPMAEFYRLIDGANKPLLSTDLIGRLYRQLEKATQSTQEAAVQARLNDLALYVRYIELYAEYSQARGEARQAAFEKLMRFTWRIRTTHMVHTRGLWRDLAGRDRSVKFAEGTEYRVPDAKNAWKSSEPFAPAELQKFIADGIANNEILNFQVVSFSNELVPATPLNLESGKPGSFNMLRRQKDFYTWIDKAPATIAFQASNGHVYNNRGEATFTLYPLAEAEMKSVAEAGVAPDKQNRELTLKTEFPGLHRIEFNDMSSGTVLSWPESVPLTIESSLDARTNFAGGRWTMYFYVPKGTEIVGGYRSALGRILTPDGKTAITFTAENNPGYWSVPVPPGQDGKLWQLSSVTGQVALMTVPPYLARNAAELLLPAEVVKADSAK